MIKREKYNSYGACIACASLANFKIRAQRELRPQDNLQGNKSIITVSAHLIRFNLQVEQDCHNCPR